MKKRVLRSIRKMPRNLLRDKQVMEDILDEMAVRWAAKAERVQSKAFSTMRTKTK